MRIFFLLIFLTVFGFLLKSQDSIAAFSKKFLGTPYRYASASPSKGFDCSGFVNYVFANFHVRVPRTSRDFMHAGVDIATDSCKAGDVIIFSGTKPHSKEAGHVGIVLGRAGNTISFIHCSSGKKKGVIISSLDNEGYRKRFLKAVRIISQQ